MVGLYKQADYAECMDSRKSSFGYLFLLGGGTIPWKSEKQFAMDMEAEFMAYFEATVQALCENLL